MRIAWCWRICHRMRRFRSRTLAIGMLAAHIFHDDTLRTRTLRCALQQFKRSEWHRLPQLQSRAEPVRGTAAATMGRRHLLVAFLAGGTVAIGRSISGGLPRAFVASALARYRAHGDVVDFAQYRQS